jgi:hypothetical protein
VDPAERDEGVPTIHPRPAVRRASITIGDAVAAQPLGRPSSFFAVTLARNRDGGGYASKCNVPPRAALLPRAGPRQCRPSGHVLGQGDAGGVPGGGALP